MGMPWGRYGAIMGHLRGIKGHYGALRAATTSRYIYTGVWFGGKGELHYIETLWAGYDIDGLGRQYRGLWEDRGCIILKDEAGRNVKDPRHPVDG